MKLARTPPYVGALIAVCISVIFVQGAAHAAQGPRIAIYGFDSHGLNPWWGSSSFDPGDALSNLLETRLVNSGKFVVLEREKLDKVKAEQKLSSPGDVSPATAAKLGQAIGAAYIVVGRIVQFDQTGKQSGGLGKLLPGGLGAAIGSSTKTELHATAKIVDVNTGQIMQEIEGDESSSANSIGVAGFGLGTAGGYQSSSFQSSAMGKLVGAVADDLAKQAESVSLNAPASVQISGRIIGIDSGSIILNVGSDKGVSVGTMFTVIETKSIHDPDSGKTITTELERGTIQVISVSKDSSVAKQISGSARTMLQVRSQ